jgi:nucleoside-diphosphate-sugar epimerase
MQAFDRFTRTKNKRTMKTFITGATGFVGSAVVKELIAAGHQVLGLARSEASAAKLIAAGAEVHYGDLEDLASLQRGAAAADGVIHAGFIHDFSRFAEVCEVDKVAIETLGKVLAGSDKPLIVTSGTALVSPGIMATEDMVPPFNPGWPRASEQAADATTKLGVRTSIIRLPPSVHGEEDLHGFVPMLINLAREKGVSAYIGDGLNRWNAVHRLDAATLYRLAMENAGSGARYHAVAEAEIPFKTIAEAIGKLLKIPVVSIPADQADQHFNWLAGFATNDYPASSKLTRERLKWQPIQSTLVADIENGVYS